MKSADALPTTQNHTRGQRRLRDHLGGRSLRSGVRMAARSFFGFTHRAAVGEALWSERERVWLGRKTFLHWALNDTAIDIPWLVTEANNAPDTDDELESAVRRELVKFWTDQLASLPRKNTPSWLPLP
ncbi:MAG: hypothetical protein KY475_01800 [Planctomycetes bacterium]|nr:hypothetical protein [Planctomycetota bacterium]